MSPDGCDAVIGGGGHPLSLLCILGAISLRILRLPLGDCKGILILLVFQFNPFALCQEADKFAVALMLDMRDTDSLGSRSDILDSARDTARANTRDDLKDSVRETPRDNNIFIRLGPLTCFTSSIQCETFQMLWIFCMEVFFADNVDQG